MPYVMGRARRGVVGSSRYAHRLRQALLEAAKDAEHRPLLIRGEPGLEKDNLAALVHYGSERRRRLLVRLDAGDLQGNGRLLLDDLQDSSLLVSGIDRLEPAVQQRLISMARDESPQFTGRVLFTSETHLSTLDGIAQLIKVPPLRVRGEDLGDWIRYMVRLQSSGLGWKQPPAVPDAVVRRLQNHDFANNLRELETLVDRALRQARQQSSAGELPTMLPEAVFWTGNRN